VARKVSVSLEADVAAFLGPVLESAHATEKLDDKVDELDRSLGKIPLESAKAAAALKLLNGDVKDVGTNFAAVGDRSSAMTILDSRIRSTRAEVKKLADEFTRTGDIDVFHKLGQASGNLSALTRIRKDLSNAVDSGLKDGVTKGAPEAARTFSSAFEGGLVNTFQSLPPELKAAIGEALVVSIVAAAAPIGAAINGVLLAGVGLGGIGLGIAGQMHNPAVKAAFAQLAQDVKSQLTAATSGFARPLVSSAHILDAALSGVIKSLGREFDDLAPHLETLARAAAALFTKAEPGFAKALEAAGPILDEMAAQMPKLGDEVGHFFALIADGSAGAKDGIDAIFLAVETLLVGIGGLVDGFSHIYEWILGPGKFVWDFFDRLDGTVTGTAHRLGVDVPAAAGTGFSSISSGARTAEQDVKDLSTQFDNLVTSIVGLDSANIRIADDWARLKKEIKGGADALDINTQKGRDNRTVLDGIVTDLERQRVAAIKAGGGTEEAMRKANAKFQEQLNKAQALAVKLGVDKQAAADYFNQFRDVSFTVTAHYHTIFTTSGPIEVGPGHAGPGRQALGGIRHAALGMIVAPSDPGTLIGEPQTGGEALIPLQGIPQSRAMGLMQVAGAGYGLDVIRRGGGAGGTMRFEHTFSVAGNADSGLATWFMRAVRRGDIQISSQAVTD
jgi:hypothetical protein